MSAPNAQAALTGIAAMAQPWGPWDDRPAGRRRLDAAVDLLTGRRTLPCPDHPEPEPVPATTCGCPAGSTAPCGVDVRVLVPLATALGLADVPAELVGHGPLDADQLAAVLSGAPRLSPVLVDEHGVPVAVGDRQVQPPRDAAGLRAALAAAAASPAAERFPTHPLDHPPPGPTAPSPAADGGRGRSHRDDDTSTGQPHHGDRGPYSIRPRLRRLLELRTLRCEWPGCGARATRCDLDHDVAWPDGPTCACNLGPLCRHHHRVKQLGWTKDRLPGGAVRWTCPTGSTFTSPAQLPPVPAVLRRLPPPPARSEPLSPLEDERELWLTTPWDALWEDSRAWVPPDPEVDPHGDRDRTRDALTTGGTRWTLDLHDPSQWAEPAPLPVEPAG